MYVQNDGRVYYFSSKKAEKNMLKLNKKARTTKWTAEFHQIKEDNKHTHAKEGKVQ